MSFSAYDSDALRVLSAALSDTLDTVRKSTGRELTETETSDLMESENPQRSGAPRLPGYTSP
jgi:hypothetical protein